MSSCSMVMSLPRTFVELGRCFTAIGELQFTRSRKTITAAAVSGS